jgi:hypothetical protein
MDLLSESVERATTDVVLSDGGVSLHEELADLGVDPGS